MQARARSLSDLVARIALSSALAAAAARADSRQGDAEQRRSGAAALEPLGAIGGPARAVAATANGERAFVGVGATVLVVDVTTRAAPRVAGQSAALADEVVGLAAAGRYVFAATRFAGVYVLDTGDAARPVVVGHLDTAGETNDLAVIVSGTAESPGGAPGSDTGSPQHLLLADGSDGMRVVDVSDPARLREVARIDTPGFAQAVAVSGPIAAVADVEGGLRLIDVTVPQAPRESGSLVPAIGGSVDKLWDVALRPDGYAVVATQRGGLRVVDVSRPAAPVAVGIWTPFGGASADAVVAVAEGYAYFSPDGSRLWIVSLVDPRSPTAIQPLQTNRHVAAIAVAGEAAFVADAPAGLRVYDATHPNGPVEAAFVGTLGDVLAVAAADGHVYAAAGPAGLLVAERQGPERVSLAGHFDAAGGVHTVRLDGRRAFAGGLGLEVLDLGDPSAPVPRGRHPSAVRDVAVAGDVVYAVGADDGLDVLSVRHPAAIERLATLLLPGPPVGVALAGDHALVACADAGLAVVDVSRPDRPRQVRVVDLPGWTNGVTVAGDHAYVAAAYDGVRVLDVADPSSPREVARLDTGGRARAVAAMGTLLAIADGAGGVLIADVSDPRQPKLITTTDAGADVRAVALDAGSSHGVGSGSDRGPVVYAALGAAGLLAFQLTGLAPEHLTPPPTGTREPTETPTPTQPRTTPTRPDPTSSETTLRRVHVPFAANGSPGREPSAVVLTNRRPAWIPR